MIYMSVIQSFKLQIILFLQTTWPFDCYKSPFSIVGPPADESFYIPSAIPPGIPPGLPPGIPPGMPPGNPPGVLWVAPSNYW